ncbi:MAG: tRNA guanosine(34) transglycosylase Tgt [Clostridiales bacterium]|nr:tRNA guanosine(34) transglycosylase Tgt [Clostridiales bacterium]
MKKLDLLHGSVALPAFFPDGTYGNVKTVDTFDLYGCHIDGIVMNAFHLFNKPGLAIVKKHGGINRFIRWDKPVLTDSGGFQVFSLLRENEKYGTIRKNEIIFRPNQDEEKIIFSPQKCIQMQFAVRSDIIMCLDHCTHPDDEYMTQKESVETTVRWAKICKDEYETQLKNYKYDGECRPLLFAIIQGGSDKALRKYCAEKLTEIGFDGFGFGGWPVDKNGNLVDDILKYTAELMPSGSVKYAMGLGRPEEIVRCADMGYNLFDCVIPTREARHRRLYVYNAENADCINIRKDGFYSYLYIADDKHAADASPVSGACDCLCCKNFSRAYVRHLFNAKDPLAERLATIHNLRFYSMLMENLRKENRDGCV